MKKKHLIRKGKKWFPLSISFWCDGEFGPYEEGCADEIFVCAHTLKGALRRAEVWLHSKGVTKYEDQEGLHSFCIDLFDERYKNGANEKFATVLRNENWDPFETVNARGFDSVINHQWHDRIFLRLRSERKGKRGVIPYEMGYLMKNPETGTYPPPYFW